MHGLSIKPVASCVSVVIFTPGMALKAVIYGPVLISVTEVISFAAGIRVIAVLVSWSLPAIIEGFPNERHIHHSRRHNRRDHRCRPRKNIKHVFFKKSFFVF